MNYRGGRGYPEAALCPQVLGVGRRVHIGVAPGLVKPTDATDEATRDGQPEVIRASSGGR
jgi:hypothetical protein